MEVDVDSKFESAQYTPDKMLNKSAFYAQLQALGEYVLDLQVKYGTAVPLSFMVNAGESRVTPPDGMGLGDLAKLRGETAEREAQQHFASMGIDTTSIDFRTNVHIGKTPYVKGVNKPSDPAYTAEQFLQLEVDVRTWPPPEFIAHEHWDPQVVNIEIGVERDSGKTNKMKKQKTGHYKFKKHRGKKFALWVKKLFTIRPRKAKCPEFK